ncbi:MAG: hypothetical protein WAW37_03120 [Syntrophobacteraceae bacterium]
MTTLSRSLSTVLVSALMLVSVSFQCLAASREGLTVVIVNPETSGKARSVEHEYTREEILSAKPLALAEVPEAAISGLDVPPATAQSSAVNDAPVITVSAGFPARGANRVARREFPDQWALLNSTAAEAEVFDRGFEGNGIEATAPLLQGWGPLDVSKHPYTSYWGNYWVSQQVQFPWKAVGKLLIRDGKSIYIGTAQVIHSDEGNLLVTAAHNVWNRKTNRPYSGFTFIPAERDGITPFGQFNWKSVRVLARYIDGSSSSRDDVALMRLRNNGKHKPVMYYTGWLGMKINLPYTLHVTAMGYSVGGGVESKWTTVSTGQTFYFNDSTICKGFTGGEDILFMGSNLVAGASGGAWLYNFRPYEETKDGNYVVSVVSGGVLCDVMNVEEMLQGPRFSDANIGVLCKYEGCTPDNP